MKADNDTYPWAVPLITYIIDEHNNNQSDFARSQGVSQSQARRWLKRRCVVIDGCVYCEVSKQKENTDAKVDNKD